MRLPVGRGCALVAAALALGDAVVAGADKDGDTPLPTPTQVEGDAAINAIEPQRCWVGGWKDAQAQGMEYPVCWVGDEDTISTTTTGTTTPTSTNPAPPESSSMSASTEPDDADSDSPLDNTRFLSFEEWKKQNLAKAGQSAENVGGAKDKDGGKRTRPGGVNNALDSLGDDAEIELEFGGFVAERPGEWVRGEGLENADREGTRGGGGGGEGSGVVGDGEEGVEGEVSRRGVARRKDAGTTCPERFNFASFDCAATVLKTNRECTGSSSVLIENKDSYMLNECGAKNKFLILELCDDILVDTVVLANYEFFSSIFRSFKISVSDRYPAKPDQWKELGMYEARNSREIQAFAVENPLIWARYLRIEFLTHYGNEFYCPVSLIRVHGTTMMEEYKHDGEEAEEVVEVEDTVVVVNATVDGDEGEVASVVDDEVPSEDEVVAIPESDVCPVQTTRDEIDLFEKEDFTCAAAEEPSRIQEDAPAPTYQKPSPVSQAASESLGSKPTVSGGEDASNSTHTLHGRAEKSSSNSTSASSSSETASQKAQTEPVDGSSSSSTTTSSAKDDDSTSSEASKVSTTTTQPPPANPTTQESFFKSVNKRLQMLESNSSLSLLYIEEQSRILRDAFDKMEKRQLAKTSTFLGNLNVTVLNELREFRQEYDHIWQSMVMEFEYQRQQHHRDIYAVTTQLGILADELVFQKRISVIQSAFVLVCFVLVLFSRGAVGSYIDLPRVQSMVMSRSQSFRSSSPPFDSPVSTRPASSYRENGGHTRDSSEELKDISVGPSIAYLPPTPTSETACSSEDECRGEGEEEDDDGEAKSQTDRSEASSVSFQNRDRSPSMRSLSGRGRGSSLSMTKLHSHEDLTDDIGGSDEMINPTLLKPSDLPQASPPRKIGGRFKGGKRRGSLMGGGNG
ncbi:hypothetical protein FQN54_007517 [Arachnomyces sp. PD_36]|nr:hypothetical protein FQN54_007517 [Arachnomyces sp. PD_36]